MRSTRFTIRQRLPGLNEIIAAINHNRYAGNSQKKALTAVCAWYVIEQKVPVFIVPVTVRCRFIEPNRRRDRDNIQSGTKFIMDALVRTGRIKDDSQRWVKNVFPEVSDVVDATNPRVEVDILED